MGVIRGTMFSDSLGFQISYTAILPEGIDGPYPVLYLLHGRSDDDHAWLYNTSLNRYVSGKKVAILMPQVHLSYYTDMAHGENYWTFISEEFPQKMQRLFRLSTKREETFVAGLSMGGYGALKLASSFPEKFNAAASFSGAIDVVDLWEKDSNRNDSFTRIFGSLEELRGSDNDLIHLFTKLSDNEEAPAFFISCGTEDFLIENNRAFYEQFNNRMDITYLEEPGDHNWDFWDRHIQKALDWMGIE